MQCKAIVYKCGCKVAWVNPWLSCIQCQHVEHSLRVWRLWRRLVSWRQGLCPNSNNDDPFFILIRWHLMPKGNIKRHTLKQGRWSKDLLEYLNKDLDALIFLVGQMQFSPSPSCKIILATTVLHNMCITDNTPLPETEGPFEGDDDHQEICHEPPSTSSGVTVRQKLICDVFS